MDSAGYGLHHVLAQTLARLAGVGHGPANAAMLPHSIRALSARAPESAAALGPAGAGARGLAARAGAERLRDLGVERGAIAGLAEAAATRAELARTPPAATERELRELYESAW
jgi:alcohol dehydrogenase class IV